MSPSGLKDKDKDEGKAPARSSKSRWDSRQQNAAAFQHALRHKYGKKKSCAERAHQISNDESPFASLEPIDQSTDNQEITDDELTADQGTNYDLAEDHEEPSKDTWKEMRRDYEAIATPGGSGSWHRVPDSVAYAAPVARGQAAFNNPGPQPHRPRPRPQQPPLPQPAPPPLQEGRHRHLVLMPESKANISVEIILRDAGFSAVWWREINNIICDLIERVGMDYTSSWTSQNKQAMGALYAWGNQNAHQNKKKCVRKGNLPMPSLEDTDNGAQPTTDEE
ncbi:hypothetical protein RSOLAG22IIIB_07249 [Rhizoctonia solani]|uniref:Uncharacterized protein n=1 Tax=Rhizoctonia solani TaxID=456999 RepID=A0A0K6FLR5_9AGAM|nr:hypothetical protein RSOLAG22IIIB_07249 [Rhizoctonia solani]